MFEVFKIVFTRIYKIAIPVFVVLFVGSNWLFPKLLEIDNLLSFRKIFSKSEWYAYLYDYLGETIRNGFQAFSEKIGYLQKSKVVEIDTQYIESDESLEDKLIKAKAEELKKQYLESNKGLDSDDAKNAQKINVAYEIIIKALE